MEIEALKALVKALKQRPEPVISESPIGLPELPELSSTPIPQPVPDQFESEQEPSGISLNEDGLNLKSRLADVLINHKGLNVEGDNFNGKLGYDGSVGINANMPFSGGQIGAGYSSGDDGRNFHLNATKKMLGGEVGLDVNNDNGNRNYYLKYQRRF